jgi:hypothetical protein
MIGGTGSSTTSSSTASRSSAGNVSIGQPVSIAGGVADESAIVDCGRDV